jgi:hypothetical protein
MTLNDDDIREALGQAARSAAPSPDAWEQMQQRHVRGRRGWRRLATASVAAIVAVGALAYVVSAFDGERVAITPSVPAPGHVDVFDLGWNTNEAATAIAAAGGYAVTAGWHTTSLVGTDGAITPVTYRQGPRGLAATPQDIWATGFEPDSGSYVSRLPIGSASPDLTIPLDSVGPGRLSGSSIVASETAVWVFGNDKGGDDGYLGTAIQIDPASGRIVHTLNLDAVVGGPFNVLYAESADKDALWLVVARITAGELQKVMLVRIDPTTYVAQTYHPGFVAAVVGADGSAWLYSSNGPVRLDPTTGDTRPVPVPDQHAVPIAAAGDNVWFLGGSPIEVRLFRVTVDGDRAVLADEFDVTRNRLWGSVLSAYDPSAGAMWLLYENGVLHRVQVSATGES